MYISPKQLKLLSAIAKSPEIRTDKNALEDVLYLHDNGLVICTHIDHPNDYFFQARISEKGKAFLYETKSLRRKTTISLVLSVIAIVISLLTAFTPFAEWSKAFISSLFQAFAK